MHLQRLNVLSHEPRNYHTNKYVYTVFSQRSGGLCFSINMNPDQSCNFHCKYCEVTRNNKFKNKKLRIPQMGEELSHLLQLAFTDQLQNISEFKAIPRELLDFKCVHLSGDGEPTLSPDFYKVVKELTRIRKNFPPNSFRLVLFTNGTGLSRREVKRGINLFVPDDEVWIKLDAGTQEYMSQVNGTLVSIETILKNIKELGSQRPVVIQSMFCEQFGVAPSSHEIEAYTQRLVDLVRDGTQIKLVQFYSVTRPVARPGCTHLPLRKLSEIANHVRQVTNLPTEVF